MNTLKKVLLGIVLTFVIGVIYFFTIQKNKSPESVTSKNIASVGEMIATRAGITIPVDADIVYAVNDAGIDEYGKIVFTTTEENWQEVMSSLALNDENFVAEQTFHLQMETIPEDEEVFATQINRLDKGDVVNIGFSRTADSLVNVYIFWHEL